MDEILKYDSVDTLRSLLIRLENVKALGLFNANEPPFTGRIHRYNIKPLASPKVNLNVRLQPNAIYFPSGNAKGGK